MTLPKFAAATERRERLIAEQRSRHAAAEADARHRAELTKRRERDARRKRQAKTLPFREALAALCNEHGFKVAACGWENEGCVEVDDLAEGETVTADYFDPFAGADK